MKIIFVFACVCANAFSVQSISCLDKPYATAELVRDEKAETFTFKIVSHGSWGNDKETREVTGLFCSFDPKNEMLFQCSRNKANFGAGAPVIRGDLLVRQTLLGKPDELKVETTNSLQFLSYSHHYAVTDREFTFDLKKCAQK